MGSLSGGESPKILGRVGLTMNGWINLSLHYPQDIRVKYSLSTHKCLLMLYPHNPNTSPRSSLFRSFHKPGDLTWTQSPLASLNREDLCFLEILHHPSSKGLGFRASPGGVLFPRREIGKIPLVLNLAVLG